MAIKQLEMASRETNLQLLNELQMLSGLKHRHIVAYLGCALVGSRVMVIMEYVCTTLAKVPMWCCLKSHAQHVLAVAVALYLVLTLAQACDYTGSHPDYTSPHRSPLVGGEN